MLEKTIVKAPARLHFGLFSVGDVSERKFGGVGLMLKQPNTVIHCEPNESLKITGPSSEDALKSIQSLFKNLRPELSSNFDINAIEEIPFHIHVDSIPARHSGFGSGTQLALATAAAISHSLGLPTPAPEEMAATLERGKRSAIGTYGFCRGGFLVDRGKLSDELLAPLDFQSDFPIEWDIVLLNLKNCQGVSGVQEMNAFDRLVPSSEQHRSAMIEMVKSDIIPGVLQKDYDQFGEAIFEFGLRSGLMFEAVQGGAYQSEPVAELVNQVRTSGVKAVGQSSWGPCVFAITPGQNQTSDLTKRLTDCYGKELEVVVTKAANQGSQISKVIANPNDSEKDRCQHLE